MRLSDLTTYLDEYLSTTAIADYPNALNGLQVANRGDIRKIAAAVDVCAATIRMATEAQAQLLLVHHGLFWTGPRPLVGPQYDRVAGLLTADLALYSSHLPLDLHADVGNNPVLARQLDVSVQGGFGELHGSTIGVWGETAGTRDEFVTRVGKLLGGTPRCLPFGPPRVNRVGIVSGAAGSLIGQAAAAGLDTFLTGEGVHHSFFDAEELKVNVIFAGHYATETVGVRALADHLASRFGLTAVFLDHPTGM
ncbi:MAG TPA: Nif3-like dinuclear metal center hexameric protein [Gemmatimonadales bacterium]|jgi:dinuclear metal center YbgI/SA1388 family protein|nr:Nif3-like dinuclear metal center hexameric protein [Gemmatimonadales bacterium]